MPNVINNIFAWLDRKPASTLNKINGYFTLPAFNIDLTDFVADYLSSGSFLDVMPLIVRKYNYTALNDFVITSIPEFPKEVNFVLAVSFTEQTGKQNVNAGGAFRQNMPGDGDYDLGRRNIGDFVYTGEGNPVYGYDYSLDHINGILSILNPLATSNIWEANGWLFDSYFSPLETRVWVTKRYGLWMDNVQDLDISKITFPRYNGELIRKNFALEIWAIDTLNQTAQLYDSVQFKSSVKKTKNNPQDIDTFTIAEPTADPFATLLQTSDGAPNFLLPIHFNTLTVQNNII